MIITKFLKLIKMSYNIHIAQEIPEYNVIHLNHPPKIIPEYDELRLLFVVRLYLI